MLIAVALPLQYLFSKVSYSQEKFMGVARSNRRNVEAGFSMIELVVVVLIAGVITAASVVMFANGKGRYQLSQKAQNISWQIERARSLAVKYNQTLTLGFTSQNSVFGITCTSCTGPKSELAPLTLPTDITLSAFPTITIKGNGTITVSNGTIVISDSRGRQVPITIANSGRTTVGNVSAEATTN